MKMKRDERFVAIRSVPENSRTPRMRANNGSRLLAHLDLFCARCQVAHLYLRAKRER